MKKVLFALLLVAALGSSSLAGPSKHTIKASARPYKALGHAAKVVGHGAVKAVATTATFSFEAFDAAVIDPFGVALQALADGVDMFIAQPLESLPAPLNKVGQGVHYVYLGVDKVGEQLAK